MFPTGAGSIEEITLRWVHIVAGIFGRIPEFLCACGRAMLNRSINNPGESFSGTGFAWAVVLRWSALVAWLAGFRYFMILAKTDAVNAGRPHAWGGWIGIWLGCWLAAFAIEMVLIRAGEGALGNKLVIGALVLFVMTATSWLVVSLLAQPGVSNRTLSISIGGGLGTILFFNVWGIAWRCQKRLIAWTRASVAQGTPCLPRRRSSDKWPRSRCKLISG